MRNLYLGVAAASLLLTAAVPVTAAQVAPEGRLIVGVDRVGDRPALEPVQYIYGGRNYCWYDGGWHGPGWYRCGYRWHRGYGWGGGYGWRGWHGGHGGGWRDGDHHGGRDGGGWRDGDHHGGRDGGGRRDGDHGGRDGDGGHHGDRRY
jgi:hypothetical protein